MSQQQEVLNYDLSNMKGFIALSSILVISAIVVTVSVSSSLLSVSEAQVSLAEQRKEEAVDFVESCIEDALLRLNETNDIPGQIALPEGICTVVTNSQSGNTWTFTASGTLNYYRKSVQVTATRDTQVTVTSWKEIP